MFSVQFNPSKTRNERASDWLPVHTDVSNRTDAGRIAQAFAVLHPERIWAVVQNVEITEPHKIASPTFKIVDWVYGANSGGY